MKRFLLLICLLVGVSGCSSKVYVEGTVTYPDGTPLTIGTVIFETENYQIAGRLDTNGHYRLGETRDGDGILPGQYGVRVSATSGGTSDGTPIVKYVAEKYENTASSGLICNVEKNTRFDFVVESFKNNRPVR